MSESLICTSEIEPLIRFASTADDFLTPAQFAEEQSNVATESTFPRANSTINHCFDSQLAYSIDGGYSTASIP
jgi:hypothetical protein